MAQFSPNPASRTPSPGSALGSTTMVFNHTGGSVVADEIFYPWGDRWDYGGSTFEERFASLQLRDTETSNDPTLFRSYHPGLYRWLSPDPERCGVDNPQEFNRYSYVINNPVNLTDPLGLQQGEPFLPGTCSDPVYAMGHAQCPMPPAGPIPYCLTGICFPGFPFAPLLPGGGRGETSRWKKWSRAGE